MVKYFLSACALICLIFCSTNAITFDEEIEFIELRPTDPQQCIYEGIYRFCLIPDKSTKLIRPIVNIKIFEGAWDDYCVWSIFIQANSFLNEFTLKLGSDGILRVLEKNLFHKEVVMIHNLTPVPKELEIQGPFKVSFTSRRNLEIIDSNNIVVWSSNTETQYPVFSNGWRNSLFANEWLNKGECLKSENALYKLCLLQDDNLVLSDMHDNQIWETNTHNNGVKLQSKLYNYGACIELKDALSRVMFSFICDDSQQNLKLQLLNDSQLLVIDMDDNIKWEIEESTLNKNIELVEILEVTFFNSKIPKTCNKTLMVSNSMENRISHPIFSSVQIKWEEEEVLIETIWYGSKILDAKKATKTAEFDGFNLTISNSFDSTVKNVEIMNYSFFEEIALEIGAGMMSSLTMTACSKENTVVPFKAKVRYMFKSGAEKIREEFGEWRGTAYSSYSVQVSEAPVSV